MPRSRPVGARVGGKGDGQEATNGISNRMRAFLDIVVAFALFRRSAINLLMIVTILHNPVFPRFCRAHPLSPVRSYNNFKINSYLVFWDSPQLLLRSYGNI